MAIDFETLALAKNYTNGSISGISGTLAGKNCTIASITDITGGHRVTFQWTADDSTTRTQTMDVMDGSGAEAIEQIYADNGVTGAKNLLPFPYANTTKTVNGCTFTVNSDESITVSSSGAISAEASFELCYALDLSEKVILTGCPSGGSTGTYCIQIYTTNSTQGSWNDFGNGYTLDLTNDSITRLVIRIRSGMDLTTPITFYPMLRLATDTDDTYQPYAMTNLELTDTVTPKKLESTATAETKAIVVIPNNYKVAYIFVSNGTDNSTELIFVNGLTDRALRFYFTNGSSKVVKGYVWCNTSQHRFELNQLIIDDVDMSKDTNTVLTVYYV